MNKINILFLSGLVLVGPSAYGMRQGIADLRQAFQAATTGVKDAGDNLPNRMYDDLQNERQGLKDDVKGFKKEADNAIGDIFELSETLFGFKGQYNTHINKLNKLKERAKTAARNTDFDFDANDEFQDLIDQESAAIEKQKRKQQEPVYVMVRGKKVRQSAQQRVSTAVMPKHVADLQRDVDALDLALNNQVNPRVQQVGRNGRIAVSVNNQRSAVTQARKKLNATIDAFKAELEKARQEVCKESPLNEAVYGGSNLRSYATMGALALGAFLFGKTVKDSETAQTVKGWFADSGEKVKTVFASALNWIAAKFA